MAYYLSPFQIIKYTSLFYIFNPDDEEKITFAMFIKPTEDLYPPPDDRYDDIVDQKVIFWKDFNAQLGYPADKSLTLLEWIALWSKLAETSSTLQKPPPWSLIVTYTVFSTMAPTATKKKVKENDYKEYLKSLKLDHLPKLTKVFKKLARQSSELDIDDNDEFLKQWLLNRDPENLSIGDYYPTCGSVLPNIFLDI
jgi:hypothetical protein